MAVNYNFEWDPTKARENLEESEEEITIRIISSRKATRKETKNYGG